MERYKRLVQFFSNPEKSLKDLYPFQLYSNTENSVGINEHDSNCTLQNDDRSGSEYSISPESSVSHYSKTFGLDDPPSRLELKRRPRKGTPQDASQIQMRPASSGAITKSHLSMKTLESDRQSVLRAIGESVHLSIPTHHSTDNENNYSPGGAFERTRKRRRSPDTIAGNIESHGRDISTANRRKNNISKRVEEINIINFPSDSISMQVYPLRLPKSAPPSPSTNQSQNSRQSNRGTSRQLPNPISVSSTGVKVSLQNTNQPGRTSGKLSSEGSGLLSKTKYESQSQRDFSQTKSVTTKQVIVQNRQDVHYKEIRDNSESQPSLASYLSPSNRPTHGSSATIKSPTKTKSSSPSRQDATHKNTKYFKHLTDETKPAPDSIGEENPKTQQNLKSKKIKRDGWNTDSVVADDDGILSSSRSETQEPYQNKLAIGCENRIININDQTSDKNNVPQITSADSKLTNALFSPLNATYLKKCLTSEGQSLITALSNKDISRLIENTEEAQKRSVKSTSSWRSTGSESTEGESILDLEKFKQAIMSVELPAEYLEQPEETETSENIFNVLETISESPLEECVTIQSTHQFEEKEQEILNETTCNNNAIENLSQRTLSGCEDLSDIQCTYVYGRESKEDQFQLQWIKLQKTREDLSEIAGELNSDQNSSANSKNDENVHVCSLNVPTNLMSQTRRDTEISQRATSITLPTKSPQSEDNSVVDIIVLREENLSEEQRAAIERYKLGMKRKRHQKSTSNTSANAVGQRVGEPIVIPISGSDSNIKSTTGFAVLTDWPEVPLSVDVDVKSWLSKSDTDETDSVIYVNQPHSKISQNTSLWTSQSINDNISEYNISENERDQGDKSLNNLLDVQSPSDRAYKRNIDTFNPHGDEYNISRVHEESKLKPTNFRRNNQHDSPMKELGNIERPRTAPPIGEKLSSAGDRNCNSQYHRSKSSILPSNQTATRNTTLTVKKRAEELQEIISHLQNYEKLKKSNAEPSQRSSSHSSHQKTQQNKNTLKTRNPSPANRSSRDGDDIKILYTCCTKTKDRLSLNDRKQYANSAQDKIKDIKDALTKRKIRRENSEKSNLSNMSASTSASEKTSRSSKSGNTRQRSTSSSRAKKDEEIVRGTDTSKGKEKGSKKRNNSRGRSHFKTYPTGDGYSSKSIPRDSGKSNKASHVNGSQSPVQRRKLSPDITITPKEDNVTQGTRREWNDVQSTVSSRESNASSDKRTVRRSTEQNISQLRECLKTLTNFREKCEKKDRIIDVLIEQLTTLPLSDNTRRHIATKVSTRFGEGTQPRKDYSYSDILGILQNGGGCVEFYADSRSPPRMKTNADEKSETRSDCMCPKYFKIAGAVGRDCLLLTWESPTNINDVAGYTVEVDGQVRQVVRSATRNSALLMDLDLKKRMRLVLHTKLRSGGEPMCHPPLKLDYTPYEESALRWNVGDAHS